MWLNRRAVHATVQPFTTWMLCAGGVGWPSFGRRSFDIVWVIGALQYSGLFSCFVAKKPRYFAE
jgi:hypothetical protein